MRTATLFPGRNSVSLTGSSVERSSSTSSTRATPNSSSPGRTPQKSFGRLPVRVAAAPVVIPRPAAVNSDTASLSTSIYDDELVRGLREELMGDMPTIELHEQEKSALRIELQALQQELQESRASSHENDEAWQLDNSRLKEQLAAASAREVALKQKLHVSGEQLALTRQELHDLQQHQLKREEEQTARVSPPLAEEGGSSGLGRERALLKLVVQLVGAAKVRSVLRENPNASPEQLREALVKLRCSQCRRLSPPSPRSTSSDKCNIATNSSTSLHELLFGGLQKPTLARPASPPPLRFNWTGPNSPDK